MLALASAIRADKNRLAELERAETGKPLALALAEVDGSANYFEFYGSLVYLPTGDVLDVAPAQHVYTKREPFGVVGVITPWNLPMNQAARAIAPALVAGNNADPVQFERQGYFCRDKDSAPGKPVFNRTVGLRDAFAKA